MANCYGKRRNTLLEPPYLDELKSMFKGLIALFTSGAIFNPLVILGIISGFFAIIKLSPEEIRDLFGDYHFYALIAILSFLYTTVFAKIYKEGGFEVDWGSTLGLVLWNFVKYFIAFVLSMSFVVLIGF